MVIKVMRAAGRFPVFRAAGLLRAVIDGIRSVGCVIVKFWIELQKLVFLYMFIVVPITASKTPFKI